jgi:uncharacterized membrane protein YfcA
MELIILAVVGLFAGVMNVLSGGGSMLTVPTMIFLGLDGSVANGTNRVALLFQNISAVYGFKRNKLSDFGLSFRLALFTLPGAVAGAVVASRLSNEVFNKVLAVILVLCLGSLFYKKKPSKEHTITKRRIGPSGYLVMLCIGFYGGFIQIGIGFLFLVSLFHILKVSLVNVNMHKVFIILIYTVPVLIVFIVTDNVNWIMGLCLAVGNATGGFIASNMSIKIGDKWIRIITVVIVLGMVGKLLIG